MGGLGPPQPVTHAAVFQLNLPQQHARSEENRSLFHDGGVPPQWRSPRPTSWQPCESAHHAPPPEEGGDGAGRGAGRGRGYTGAGRGAGRGRGYTGAGRGAGRGAGGDGRLPPPPRQGYMGGLGPPQLVTHTAVFQLNLPQQHASSEGNRSLFQDGGVAPHWPPLVERQPASSAHQDPPASSSAAITAAWAAGSAAAAAAA